MQGDTPTPFALIVEDHPLVASSLAACIRDCDAALAAVGAETLGAALHILASRPAPALILTDLALTDTNGIETVRRLRAAAPQSALLVVTAQDDAALRSQATELGAIGYLVKTASIQALREEIRAVIGRCEIKGGAAPATAEPLNGLLTPKQITVLEELAAGRSNKEIAARLGISDVTVASHMKEILGRLAVRNRTEAVVRYLQCVNPSSERTPPRSP
ncbi:MAG: response regulator transcription factor [Rhodocyclales bacterium]|nr:response regulator transcription factor [Rhodocyclales bacterium]